MNALTLTPGSLTLKQLRHVWRQPVTLSLDESAHFTESRVETAWPSLRHSCRSELTRQGISLP